MPNLIKEAMEQDVLNREVAGLELTVYLEIGIRFLLDGHGRLLREVLEDFFRGRSSYADGTVSWRTEVPHGVLIAEADTLRYMGILEGEEVESLITA